MSTTGTPSSMSRLMAGLTRRRTGNVSSAQMVVVSL